MREPTTFRRWVLRCVAALSVTIIPASAFAAAGYATATVSMRAGPGTEYPRVDTIPADAHIDIHGCLNDHTWCDVSWNGNRGWISAAYLDYLYNNRYVYLPDYVADVPVVVFSLDTYWGDYYRGRPWYGRLTYWRSFWHNHGRHGFGRHGFAQNERGTTFEQRNRVQQSERFRNRHEFAGNNAPRNFAGRQFQGRGGRTFEHAPGNRSTAAVRQFTPQVRHQVAGPRMVNRGQKFGRAAGFSARASVGGTHFGGGGAHFGGGGRPGGGAVHFAGGGGGGGHGHKR